MLASAAGTALLAISAAQFVVYGVLWRALHNISVTLTEAVDDRNLVRARVQTMPPLERVISRSMGGTVGDYEITLVGEDGREYVALPAGTQPDLAALLQALRDGSVLIIVGASGAEHVRLPAGSIVYTAAQTVDMFLSSDLPGRSDEAPDATDP